MEGVELTVLRERWSPELAQTGNAFLLGKAAPPLPDLPDGRKDLRGLPISVPVKYTTLADADLSGAITEGFGQFNYARVWRCVFVHAELTTNLRREFLECDFRAAKLAGAGMCGTFCDCDFAGANLSSVVGKEVRFIRCSFLRTNFRKATLIHTHFEDCVFGENKFGSGSLGGSKFIRSPLDVQQLGNTLMEKTVFTD